MSPAAFPLMVGLALLGLLIVLVGIFPSPEDRSREFPKRVKRAVSRGRKFFTRRNVIAGGAGFLNFLGNFLNTLNCADRGATKFLYKKCHVKTASAHHGHRINRLPCLDRLAQAAKTYY